jgi:hypothetical protein
MFEQRLRWPIRDALRGSGRGEVSDFEVAVLWDAFPRDQEQSNAAIEETAVGLAMVDGRIRIISISRDGRLALLEGSRERHKMLYVADSRTAALQNVIDELEYLVNTRTTSEAALQNFFERNPYLITGDDYSSAHPHVVLEREDRGPLVPDFLLEPLNQAGLCDLLELKLPKSKLFVERKNRNRMSAAVAEACAQLRTYRDYFESQENRERVRKAYGFNVFRPNMYVVIGRRGSIPPMEIRAAEADMPLLRIKTYDDLLDRARLQLRRPIGSF